MFSLRRACVAVLVGGLIAFGIGAVPAAARVVDHGQFHNTRSEVIEVCGLTLRRDIDIRGMFVDNSHGPEGLVYLTETNRGTETWTNLANDLTMTEVIHNVQKDLKVTDNGDGTLTVIRIISGVHNLKGPDGKIERTNSGTVWTESLIDHRGTPTDRSDDPEQPLAFRHIKDAGLNEFDDFCADIHELIG
jgi:hypothetical protein